MDPLTPQPPTEAEAADPTRNAWRRWLPIAAAVVVLGAIATIIVIANHGDDGSTTGDTANTATGNQQSTAAEGSIGPSVATASTAVGSTSASGAGSPTTVSTSASTATTVAVVPVSNAPETTVAPTPTPAAQVDLGTAADFAILANLGVTSEGTTAVSGGQVGASNGSVDGFGTDQGPNGLIIASAQSALQAQLNADHAAEVFDAMTPNPLPGTQLIDQTISPGVYGTSTLGVAGTVTLDAGGDPNAVFIFLSSSLTIAPASQVVLEGGAQACNVYWRLTSTATFGSGSVFIGTVLADDVITAAAGSDITGRLITRNSAVTLDSDVITLSPCA